MSRRIEIVVRDKEAGNVICEVASLEEGLELIEKYEASDILEGIYKPDYYECVILD